MMLVLQGKREAARDHLGLHLFLDQALKERWRKYRKALKRCRKKFSEEAVHQWRIETRRMLALLGLLEPFLTGKCLCQLESEFTKHFKKSAPLRDTHVLLLEVEKRAEAFPVLAPFRKFLARREQRLCRRLRKKIGGAGEGDLKPRMRQLRQRLRRLVEHAETEEAHREKLFAAVDLAFEDAARLRAGIDPAEPATIHAMRVAFKKFRYMVETLRPMLPGVSARQIAAMQAFQTSMGDIQDVEVLAAALARFEKKRGLSLDRFNAYLRRRHSDTIRRFMRTVGKLDEFRPSRPSTKRARREISAKKAS